MDFGRSVSGGNQVGYNSSQGFSTFGVYGGGGDIVLNRPRKSRAKKWWALVLVALVLACTVVGVVMVWGNVNGNNLVQNKFNIVANYILYGEANNSEIVGDHDGHFYNYSKKVMNNDWASEYFKESHDLYATFEDNVDDVAVKELGDIIDFFYAYTEFGAPTFDDIREVYVEYGEDEAKEYYRKKYNVFDMANSVESEYVDLFEVLLEESLMMLEYDLDYMQTVSYPTKDIAKFLFSKSVRVEKLCFGIRDLLKEGIISKNEKV